MRHTTPSEMRRMQNLSREQERARKLQEALMDKTHFDNVLHVMEVRGGSFIKSLAHCYYVADSANRDKLRAAFAEYFDNYEAQFKAWKAQQIKEAA